MANSKIRVLYISNMTVSPGSGGGNTVFNLLEPSPADAELFYATPATHPKHWKPFPELAERICWFSNDSLLPRLPGTNRVVKHLNRLSDSIDSNKIVTQLMHHICQLRIDLLLVCPQGRIVETAKVVEMTDLPVISWFMDNYYTDQVSMSCVDQICQRSQSLFVVSESMQRYFIEAYHRGSQILNNSVSFPARFPGPKAKSEGALRMAYAGALNSYYHDSMVSVLRELEGLKGRVSLDIYSHEKLPPGFAAGADRTWTQLLPVPAAELGPTLQQYDVLLMLSSFQPEHRAIAESSLASKWADYLAAGRAILCYGPAYAENVRYAQRYNFAEFVTSEITGALRGSISALADNPGRRNELGRLAFQFGLRRHDKAVNRERLRQAIFRAVNTPQEKEIRA